MKKAKKPNSIPNFKKWIIPTISNEAWLDAFEESRMMKEGYDFSNLRREVYLDPALRKTRYNSIEKAISRL